MKGEREREIQVTANFANQECIYICGLKQQQIKYQTFKMLSSLGVGGTKKALKPFFLSNPPVESNHCTPKSKTI